MAKKTPKKTKKEEARNCPDKTCGCSAVLAILIIVLLWVSTANWSKVVITIAAILLLLGALMPNICCRTPKKK